MAVFILILIASFIIGLNFATNGRKSATLLGGDSETHAVPVARTYKVLYWYAGLHLLYGTVVTAWEFLFQRPWKRFTPQYVADHHLHKTVHFLQTQDKVVILIFCVVSVAMYIYLFFARSVRAVVALLGIFVGLDVLALLSALAKPTYSTFRLILDVAVSAFTFLVFWSLLMKEPDFLKMFRSAKR